MYDILVHPITLLCLGIVFILIALLFFYFKRTISVLEKSQANQAKLLHSFISQMEMASLPKVVPAQHGVSQQVLSNTEPDNSQNQELIDVSDSDDDSEESDDESENSDSNIEEIDLANTDSPLEEDIKVIQLDNNLEENNENEQNEINDDEDDEDDEDDDDEDDDDEEDDEDQEENTDQDEEASSNDENKMEDIVIDYKTLTLQSLKEIAEKKNLIKKGEKITKKNLIELLQSSP
tara:strand:+ start:7950 stop:8654 length:705 start_codon:yes stop_codon:yes gene_type:complete